MHLEKGVHNIFEWAGVATITLKWRKPGKGNFERIPASAFGPLTGRAFLSIAWRALKWVHRLA